MSRPARTLSVREWSRIPIGQDGLSSEEAERLATLAHAAARRLRLQEDAVLSMRGRALHAGQVCGLLAIPGLAVEILPKIALDEVEGRRTLIRMLAVAHDLPIAEGDIAGHDTQRSDLLEILLRVFAQRTLAALRTGLPRAYVTYEDDLGKLRGALRVKRQVTAHAARPDLLACRFDELSPNVPLNRVIAAALHRFRPLIRSGSAEALFDEAIARMAHVPASERPLEERVTLDRTSAAWHMVYSFARMLLSRTRQGAYTGSATGVTLLFPMNELFERWAGRMFRRALGPRVHLQHGGRHVTTCRKFALRPDMVIDPGSTPIIVDTKWKALEHADQSTFGVSSADVYQMLAYGGAYEGAAALVLLYPATPSVPAGLVRDWALVGNSARLRIATIDPGRSSRLDLSHLLSRASLEWNRTCSVLA